MRKKDQKRERERLTRKRQRRESDAALSLPAIVLSPNPCEGWIAHSCFWGISSPPHTHTHSPLLRAWVSMETRICPQMITSPAKRQSRVRNVVWQEKERRTHLQCQQRRMCGTRLCGCISGVLCNLRTRTCTPRKWKDTVEFYLWQQSVRVSCLIDKRCVCGFGLAIVLVNMCVRSLLKPLRASALTAELGKRPDTCHPAPSVSCLRGTWISSSPVEESCRIVGMCVCVCATLRQVRGLSLMGQFF